MANTFQTSRKTELIALRAAESAAYLTVGSRKYFKDQLKGKRNGTAYDFVVRDAGEYARGIDISTGGTPDLVERKVTKTLKVSNVKIGTNILERVTDLDWDKEIAIPNGKKLVNGAVRDVIDGLKGKTIDGVTYTTYDGDFGNQNTAFFGIGYGPMTGASNFLASVSDEDRYFFIDPQINAKLSDAGDAFKPKDADPMFSKGLIGTLGGQEVRTCQFMPLVSVSTALATAMATVDGFAYVDNSDGTASITLTASNTPIAVKIPKGFVIWVKGVYATDLVGDRTNCLKAFIAVADGTSNGVMIAKSVDEFVSRGTKQLCDANGDALGTSKAAAITALNTAGSAGLLFLEAGNYFTGIVRLDGAMEFETLDEIDASNAETELAKNEGINVFQNRAIDVLKGTNVTRWTTTHLSGIVEPRACSLILVKDADVNKVKLV